MIDLDSIPSFVLPGVPSDIDEHYQRAVEHFEGGTFVEVGVFCGRSVIFLAQEIKRQNKPIKVYAVDTYTGNENDPSNGIYVPVLDTQGGSTLPLFKHCMNLAGVEDIITPIQKLSPQAAEDFEDESLDLVFIDGDHSFEGCYQDMKAFWPKVKPGGWLSGHDYGRLNFGVIRAVGHFADEVGHYLSAERTCWKIVKK